MGTTLTGKNISASYLGLLKSTDSLAIGGTKKIITDGAGNDLPFGISTSSLTFNAGAVDVPTLSIGTINEGFYQPTDETLGVTINGSEVARFNSTGLGIGVSPASGFKLTTSDQSWIKGGLLVGGTNGNRTNGSTLVIDGGGDSSVNLRFILNSTGHATSDGGQIIFSNSGALSLRSLESGGSNYGINLQQKGGSTILFAEATNKNVGINTLTPSSKLTISGGDILLDNSNKLLWGNTSDVYIAGTTSADNIQLGVGGATQFTFAQTTGMRLHQYGSGNITGTATQRLGVDSSGNVIEIPIGAGALDGSGTAGKIAKFTDSDTLGDSVINEVSSKIGIGVATPAGQLHIAGDAGGAGQIYISDADNGVTASDSLLLSKSGVHGIVENRDSGDLRMGTNDDNTFLVIKPSGNVAIGGTTANAKLHISGISQTGTVNAFKIDNNTSNTKFAIDSVAGDYKLQFKNAGNTVKVLLNSNGDSHLTGGNVGISTDTPVTLLDLSNGNSQGDGIGFGSNLSEIRRGNSGANLQMSHFGNVSMIIDSDGNDSARFFNVMHGNNDSASATELFRVNEDGAILVTSDGSDADGANITLKHANNNTTDTIGTIYFGNNQDDTLSSISTDTLTNNTTSNLIFKTSSTGTLGEAVRITESGTLLVGTTSAQSGTKFQVDGVSYFQGVNTTNGTAVFVPESNKGTAQSHIHYGTTGDWFIRPASNSGKVVVADNTSMKVAIGTATPASTKLTVVDSTALTAQFSGYSHASSSNNSRPASGSIRLGDGTGSTGLLIDYTDQGQTIGLIKNEYVATTTSELRLQSPFLSFYTGTSPSERGRIDASGNFLLGTTSASSFLTVKYDSAISLENNAGSGITVRNTNNTSGSGATITFEHTDATTGVVAKIGAINDPSTTDDNGILTFSTRKIGVGMKRRMTIDSDGLVGFGTNTPIYDVQIGEYGASGVGSSDSSLALASAVDGTCVIRFGDGTSGTEANAGQIAYNHSFNSMVFRTSANEAMRLDSSGRLLINRTSSNGDILEVDGNANVYSARFNGSSTTGQSYGLRVRAGTNSSDKSMLVENTSGTDLFAITGDGNATFAGDVTLESSTSTKPFLTIKNTNADGQAPQLRLIKDSASPADNDETGRIYMYGDNDAGEQIETLLARTIFTDVSDGNEDSKFEMLTYRAGTQTTTLSLESGNVSIRGASADAPLQVRQTRDTNGNMRNNGTYGFIVEGNDSGAVGEGIGIHLTGKNTNGSAVRGVSLLSLIQNTGNAHDLVICTSDSATAPAERARVTDVGDFIVGKSTIAVTSPGVEARSSGLLVATRNAGTAGIFNREGTTKGNIVDIRQDNSPVITLGTTGDNVFVSGTANANDLLLRTNAQNRIRILDYGLTKFDTYGLVTTTPEARMHQHQIFTMSCTAGTSGTAKAMANVGNTNAFDYTIVARIDADDIGVIAGRTATANGTNSGFFSKTAYSGDVSAITPTYNASSDTLDVAVTYSGSSTVTVSITINGISDVDISRTGAC